MYVIFWESCLFLLRKNENYDMDEKIVEISRLLELSVVRRV